MKFYDIYLIHVMVMFTAITPVGKKKKSPLLTIRMLLITLALVNTNDSKISVSPTNVKRDRN